MVAGQAWTPQINLAICLDGAERPPYYLPMATEQTPRTRLVISGVSRTELQKMLADTIAMRDRYSNGNGSAYWLRQYNEQADDLRAQLAGGSL